MANEIELKLLADATQVNRLRRIPELRARASGRPRHLHLLSVYYDTPGQDLRRRGIALRVRRRGRTHIQCAKTDAASAGGILVRVESEIRVPGLQPDINAIPDIVLRARVQAAVGERPLVPLFRTDIRRSSRELSTGVADGAISLDIDVGEVVSGDRREPICEVELELVRGAPEAIYEIAREIRASVPLRVSVDSKAARGYRLTDGVLPEPVRARAVELDRDSTVDDALVAIFGSALEQIVANERPLMQNDDVEGVHQMRVGCRRARSVLSTFKGVLPATEHGRMNALLKALGARLGPIRDLDVVVDELVAPIVRALPSEESLSHLVAALGEARTRARANARQAVSDPMFTDTVLVFGEWIATRGWRRQELSADSARLFVPARELGAQLLGRLFAKLRKKAKRFPTAPPEERHALRIDVKKLRYGVEFFGSLYKRRPAARFARRLSRLQDGLGRLNDVYVAGTLMERIGRPSDPAAARELDRAAGIVEGWCAHAADADADRLEKRVAEAAAAKPFWTV